MEGPILEPSRVYCTTRKRRVRVEDWQSHVNGHVYRRNATLKIIEEWKRKKRNGAQHSVHGSIYDAPAPTAAEVHVKQWEAIRGVFWNLASEAESGQNDQNYWGDSSCGEHQRSPKPKAVHNSTGPCASQNSVSSEDVLEYRTRGRSVPPSHSSHSLGAESPACQDLVVTYWITIESGERRIHIPIEPEQVAGPEKSIIDGDMNRIWSWVQSLKIEDRVSLQDVFDLAQAVHSVTAETADISQGHGSAWDADEHVDSCSHNAGFRTFTY
ncbi:hypothetical protein PMIN06_010952 [Paraphaeosphaeria minitans]